MLHVNISAGAILKFIKVHTYGTDPVHLESAKFKGLVGIIILRMLGWREQKNLSFENAALYIKHSGLSNIRVVLNRLQINLQNFFSYGL